MFMKTIKVWAEGTYLVPDYDAMEQGKLRFIGRYHSPDVGINGGWVPHLEPVTIPYRAEYIQELRAGTLSAGDKETARLAKVQYNPIPGLY
jgi:hypothetical protein